MGWSEPPTPTDAARRARAVCTVLRAQARDGADEEVEALLGDFAHRVRAEEPDCVSYVVTRTLGSRSHFAVVARFSDWDAFEDHAETAHLERLLPRLTALLAAPVSMEILFEI